jgi:hypothetical protein
MEQKCAAAGLDWATPITRTPKTDVKRRFSASNAVFVRSDSGSAALAASKRCSHHGHDFSLLGEFNCIGNVDAKVSRVLSSFECPRSNCTARKFLVRL